MQKVEAQYYMVMDIETGGSFKPIFALGAVVFKVNDDKSITFEEQGLWNFAVPEKYDDMYYNKDTWDNFWGPIYKPWNAPNPNFTVLQTLNSRANCVNEADLINKFYNFWITITNKYKNIRIVTDSPTFDVGYVDSKIEKYRPADSNWLPLVHQWSGNYSKYVSTIDYNTCELLFEMNIENDYDKLEAIIGTNPYNHDHNPLNDCKHLAFQFSKIVPFIVSKIM